MNDKSIAIINPFSFPQWYIGQQQQHLILCSFRVLIYFQTLLFLSLSLFSGRTNTSCPVSRTLSLSHHYSSSVAYFLFHSLVHFHSLSLSYFIYLSLNLSLSLLLYLSLSQSLFTYFFSTELGIYWTKLTYRTQMYFKDFYLLNKKNMNKILGLGRIVIFSYPSDNG